MNEIIKNKQRSKAYPGTPLEECIRHALKIKKMLGPGKHDRLSLAQAIGFKTVSGPVGSKIAALVHFGILDKIANTYSLSPESSRLTDPINDEERKMAVRDAFFSPTLFREIIEKFQSDGQVPVQLAVHLYRFHGIAQNAAEKVASIFRDSAEYAGIISQDGKILDQEHACDDGNQMAAASDIANPPVARISQQPIAPNTAGYIPGKDRLYVFPLSKGNAELRLPSQLSKRDVTIIKKHIEILELDIEESPE